MKAIRQVGSKRSRLRRLGVIAAAAVWVCAGTATAEQSSLTSALICKGDAKLVLCVLRLQTLGLTKLSWADATIEEAPAFVRPVMGYASYKNDGVKRPNLRFALVPQRPGQGTVAVRLRATVCPEGPLCENVNRVLKAQVAVAAK